MKNRARIMIALLLLVTIPPMAMQGVDAAEPCTTPAAAPPITTALTITGTTKWECVDVLVQGNVTVSGGAKLQIIDSIVRLGSGNAGRTISASSGATLDLNRSDILTSQPGNTKNLIVYQTGALGEVNQTKASGATIELRSTAVRFTWAGACPTPRPRLATIPAELVIAGKTTWQCMYVYAAANIRVPTNAALHVHGSVIEAVHAANAERSVTVESGGRLVLLDSAIVQDTTHATRGVRVTYAAGSLGKIHSSLLNGYKLLELRAPIPITDAAFENPTTDGLRILDASPTINGLTLQGGLTGIRIQGSANPTIVNSDIVGATAQGVFVDTGARATIKDDFVCAGDVGVFLQGTARATMHKSSFCSTVTTQAKLVPLGTGAPRLDLEGVPHTLSKIVREGNSVFSISWLVDVEATNADQPTSPVLTGVKVVFRNATGADQATGFTDETRTTEPAILVPERLEGPSGAILHNPYTILLSKGSSVGSLTGQTVSSNREGDARFQVPMSLDADTQAPVWTVAAPLRDLQSVPGRSIDGNALIEWIPANDTVGGTKPSRGIATYEVLITTATGNRVVEVSENKTKIDGLGVGENRVKVRAIDLAGNPSLFSNELTFEVDQQKPFVTFATNRTSIVPRHFNRAFNVSFSTTDPVTAGTVLHYRIDGAGPFQPYVRALNFTEDGAYNVTVRATDRAGNVNETVLRFVLDRQVPGIVAGLTPNLPDGQNGWYREAPKLVATGIDFGKAGVHDVRFRIGASTTWTPYVANTKLSVQGDDLVHVQVRDRSNNTANTTLNVRVDAQAPTLNVRFDGTKGAGVWYSGLVTLQAGAQDTGAGIQLLQYRLGQGPWLNFQDSVKLEYSGSQQVTVQALDRAGNLATSTPQLVAIDSDKPVAPVVVWTADDEGRVHADWTDGPPVDLSSGLGHILLEQGDKDGNKARSFGVPVNATGGVIGPFQVGTHYFRVATADLAQNVVYTPWTTVIVRTSIGGLSAAGEVARVRGPLLVDYVPPEGFVPVEVLFYVDDELAAAMASPPYQFSWDTQAVDDGTHKVRIVAKDQAGSVQETIQVYNVRNTYKNVVADNAVPFGVASIGSVAAVGTSFFLVRRWRTV